MGARPGCMYATLPWWVTSSLTNNLTIADICCGLGVCVVCQFNIARCSPLTVQCGLCCRVGCCALENVHATLTQHVLRAAVVGLF